MTIPAPLRGPATDTDGEPWIGYIRVSTWREEKISPELQQASIEAWATRTGRRIVEWIVDLDESGRHFRRKIMRGIERVEAGAARGVAVWKFSRFGRNDLGVRVNLARLEHVGGQLASATEDVDATTAVGRFNRAILFDLAVFESDRASEQWIDTHNHRRDTLKLPATGRDRFGYIWHRRWDPRTETLQRERYEINGADGSAEAAYEAYERKVAGESFAAIAGWLNGCGYRTVRGGLWSDNSIRRYLDSGFAAGLLRVHHRTCKCGALWSCPNYSFQPGAQPRIIPEGDDLWDRYLKHREQTRDTPPRARNAVYMLSGLMKHGDCRHGMGATGGVINGESIPGHTFRCTHAHRTGGTGCRGVWIARPRAERETYKWLAREAAAGIDAAPTTPPQQRTVADARARAASERQRLTALLAKLQRGLANLRADHATNPEDYGPGEYEAARARIVQQREAAEIALAAVADIEATPDRADYEVLMARLLDGWTAIDPGERRDILRALLRRVAVYRVDRPGYERGTSRLEWHPVWEPDPWAEDSAVSGT